jgi:quinol monooxygenase YgiN
MPKSVNELMEKLLVKIRARDDKQSELMQACHYISQQTLQVRGCKSSLLIQDSDKCDLITLEQQWDQRSLLNDYFRSDHFTALMGAMKWLGRTFEIHINGGTHEEGVKIIQSERMT